jgi:rod shape-determining protein MreC
MESLLGRYRNLTILVGVLFLQVLGLAVQVKRSADAQNTRLIRVWAVDLITPFERVLVNAQNDGDNLWHNYFFLRGVRAENRDLKQQIEQMRLDEASMREDAAQAHRLQALLNFKEQFIAKTVAAQVIGSSGSELSRSVYIDKGSNDGIAPDMAVITAGGIVGKVLHVYPSTSQVLLINDQSSGAGVLMQNGRLHGVLHGTPNGELTLSGVMTDEQVAAGDVVLSSGGEQIFPKGLPVGTVARVSPGREMFLDIKVKPAADLNRLEEVLVVTEKQERAPTMEAGPATRAADILAQRLPSVPDQPAVAATAAKAPTISSTSSAISSPSAIKPQPGLTSKPAVVDAAKSTTAALHSSTQVSSTQVEPKSASSSTPTAVKIVPAANQTPSSAASSRAAPALPKSLVSKSVVSKPGVSQSAVSSSPVSNSTSSLPLKTVNPAAKAATDPAGKAVSPQVKPQTQQPASDKPAGQDEPH